MLGVGAILSRIPISAYVGAAALVVFGGIAAHLVIQRNEARADLETARTEIRRLDGDNATLRGNNASLQAGVDLQNESLRKAASAAAKVQERVAADLKIADQKRKDAEARVEAWKEIQKAGDRAQGGNYAHDVRRARLRP